MRNIFGWTVVSFFIISFSVLGFSANTSRIPYGSLYDSTADNFVVTPDSFTVTTISATVRGIRRIVQNLGPNYIYIDKTSTTNVQSKGIKISSGTIYTDTEWMGEMYIQVEAGGDPSNVRIENITIQ